MVFAGVNPASLRRIKKTVDGYTTTYLYDGDHIIAEYDGNSNLVRKYVYGPRDWVGG